MFHRVRKISPYLDSHSWGHHLKSQAKILLHVSLTVLSPDHFQSQLPIDIFNPSLRHSGLPIDTRYFRSFGLTFFISNLFLDHGGSVLNITSLFGPQRSSIPITNRLLSPDSHYKSPAGEYFSILFRHISYVQLKD